MEQDMAPIQHKVEQKEKNANKTNKKCYVIPLKQSFLKVFNWETTKEVFLVKYTE